MRRMRHRHPLLALLRFLAATPALPQQGTGATTYTVELVVFRGVGGNGSEEPQQVGLLSSDDPDGGAGGASGPSRLLQVLPADKRRLRDVASRLNASGTYRVIAQAAWQQTAASFNSRTSLPAEQLGLEANGLTGAVYLQRGQYLHLGLNLTWAGNGGSFTINERRRTRIGERMYFDHPAFGVIALVTAGPP